LWIGDSSYFVAVRAWGVNVGTVMNDISPAGKCASKIFFEGAFL
jgi:hypothetical protein